MTNPAPSSGLTVLGKLFSVLLVLGLITLGAWVIVNRMGAKPPAGDANGSGGGDKPAAVNFDASAITEAATSVPRLDPPGTYTPQNNIIDIELSEYPGYAGIIAANGGLEPSDNSVFAQKHGFKVRIKISEEESWSALNSGKMAASATTADVLAVYGRQFQVVVPAQIGYSRGADGILVRADIKRFNDLKGKVLAAAQFTEADFFARYLASEAGIGIKMLGSLKDELDAEKVNMIYCDEGPAAGDIFLNAIKANSDAIAGASTWAPKTSEVPVESGGKARLLVSNKNLLIIADILIVNRGFAEANPKMVEGLVDGLLEGNKRVRDNPESQADIIGKAFKWDRAKTLAQLKQVHFSNLPEQMAFLTGTITQGGSFNSIFQSAILAYGDIISNPADSERFISLTALQNIERAGTYRTQVAAITPLQSPNIGPAELDPVLSKDIRFLFQPMSSDLDMTKTQNLDNLKAIKRILDVAPGSRIVLVGHVDNSNIPNLRKSGGEELVKKMALEAMQLSKDRAAEVKKQLADREKVDAKRLETIGRGWTQPVSETNIDANRRVEVQWFTLE